MRDARWAASSSLVSGSRTRNRSGGASDRAVRLADLAAEHFGQAEGEPVGSGRGGIDGQLDDEDRHRPAVARGPGGLVAERSGPLDVGIERDRMTPVVPMRASAPSDLGPVQERLDLLRGLLLVVMVGEGELGLATDAGVGRRRRARGLVLRLGHRRQGYRRPGSAAGRRGPALDAETRRRSARG